MPEPTASSELYDAASRAMKAGELERAVELFRQSIDENPHFKSLELLGECLLGLGRAKEAVVPLAAATALNRQLRAPALLARALAESGETEDARERARAVLAREPRNRAALAVASSLPPLPFCADAAEFAKRLWQDRPDWAARAALYEPVTEADATQSGSLWLELHDTGGSPVSVTVQDGEALVATAEREHLFSWSPEERESALAEVLACLVGAVQLSD